jgi:hypothetical protein
MTGQAHYFMHCNEPGPSMIWTAPVCFMPC